VVRRQLLERPQHIGDEQASAIDLMLWSIHDSIGRALFQCLCGKFVAVKIVAFQGKKNTAGRQLPGISADGGVLSVNGIKFRYGKHIRAIRESFSRCKTKQILLIFKRLTETTKKTGTPFDAPVSHS